MFIDDERALLEGLERALGAVVEDDCELVFVTNGADALVELARQRFDVVVTDMHMPGMDGAELLERVYLEQPDALRLVLSGDAKSDAIVSSARFAHQFISKPAAAASIYALVQANLRMRQMIECPAFRRAVARVDRLPVIPAVYRELSVELDKSEASIRSVAAVVERDPALVAKLLQLVNSAFFGNGKKITTVADAASRVGFAVIKALALAGIFGVDAPMRAAPVDLASLQARSLEVATLARSLAPVGGDVAFTGALLRDCGVLVLATTLPDQIAEIWTTAARDGRATHDVEREIWGTDHAEIGAYLLTLWGLPAGLVDVVARHHAAPDDDAWSVEAAAVRVAGDIVDGVTPDRRLVERLGGNDRVASLTSRRAA